MIQAGMVEDPEYTQAALRLLLSFDDIVNLAQEELAEVLARMQPRILAMAILGTEPEVQARMLRCAPLRFLDEIQTYLGSSTSSSETNGARLRVIGVARQCEKAGLVRTKRIPR